ncbi:MAG: winged helix-turn-helix transcriptional regulator [Anaerolineales bacterium]|nr:winged helix-turn-helix transcriptional regulator [Anaerolineales bacterium]
MPPFDINLEKTTIAENIIEIEPALNALESMFLVSNAHDQPGIHEWIAKTRASMTSDEFFRHKLVLIGLHYSIMPTTAETTFEAYLAKLEKTSPSMLRERLLNAYSGIYFTEEARKGANQPVNWDEVLSSAENYVKFLRSRFGEKLMDEDIEIRAYDYVIDPAALKQLVTGHIRWFWKNHLQAEWTRVRPMLEESARAFNKLNLSAMTRADQIKFVTGKEIEEDQWGGQYETAGRLIFVPNAHLGPYIHKSIIGDNFYIHFGAHTPEGSDEKIPELDRSEIVSRLSPLADSTRLQILHLIIEKGEMRSQEIMEATNLSQPSVSRYLSQLTATSYLQERRKNGAKVYIASKDSIEKTLKAVTDFLLGS